MSRMILDVSLQTRPLRLFIQRFAFPAGDQCESVDVARKRNRYKNTILRTRPEKSEQLNRITLERSCTRVHVRGYTVCST